MPTTQPLYLVIPNPDPPTLLAIEKVSEIMAEASPPRVVLVGDSGVGKTSLIHRAKYNKFNEAAVTTIGAGITPMDATHNGVHIDYQLWDTAGQEIYRSIVPMYFRGVCGVIVVFSMTERSSFMNLNSWFTEIQKHIDNQTPILLVGNKTDCPNDAVVSMAEVSQYSCEKKIDVVLTSASTGENVDVMLKHIIERFVVPSLRGEGINLADDSRFEGESCC